MLNMIVGLRRWTRGAWASTAGHRRRQQVDDPLTRADPLLQFAPASRGEPAVVAYLCDGAHVSIHAVLDVPYRSRNGTVHVVCPVGPRHGGMGTYIENVAEQIRRHDPDAAALIMAWPEAEERRPDGEPLTGLLGAHHIRVTFGHINRHLAEDPADAIADESRYSEPHFDHQDPSDNVAHAVFGIDSPFPTTYAEVETTLARASELTAAVAKIEDGWEAEPASAKRLSAEISAQARKGTPPTAAQVSDEKPSKYTVLLNDTDALMWDELAIVLRRELGWKIDKSAMVRALVDLAAEDDDLRRQLAHTLAPRTLATRSPTSSPPDTVASPSVEKPSKYTVLLDDTDALKWDQLAITLRRDLRRKIDKSSMVRALVSLAVDDDDILRQLADALEREGAPAE